MGDIFHYVNGKYGLHQRAYRIHVVDDKMLSTKYLFYYLKSLFKKYILSNAVSATVSSIRKPMLENFPLTLPPLELQNVVVKVLDEFQALVANTNGVLPQEIALRQKQYEHYREALLNFGTECAGGG